jgi:hypothetical protein
MNFKKEYDSAGREVWCDILTGFGVSMKLVLFMQLCLNYTCGVAWKGKHLCDTFPVHDGLKQILLPFLFNAALECAI